MLVMLRLPTDTVIGMIDARSVRLLQARPWGKKENERAVLEERDFLGKELSIYEDLELEESQEENIKEEDYVSLSMMSDPIEDDAQSEISDLYGDYYSQEGLQEDEDYYSEASYSQLDTENDSGNNRYRNHYNNGNAILFTTHTHRYIICIG